MCLKEWKPLAYKSVTGFKVFVKNGKKFGSLVFEKDNYEIGETYVALDNGTTKLRGFCNRLSLEYRPKFHTYKLLRDAKRTIEVLLRWHSPKDIGGDLVVCKVRLEKNLIKGRSTVTRSDTGLGYGGQEMTILEEVK